MLQIQAIKIVIHTTGGDFGRLIKFTDGLNIIRANNTSGKSSLFGALIYGLGFEELLLGKNEKALQSVFKSLVKDLKFEDEKIISLEHTVTQSEIFLEISNGKEIITTKRYVINSKIKPQAIEVFHGPLVSDPTNDYERTSMYVHDRGAATNDEIGFHKFLESFIGAKLPEIVNQDGVRTKLYLPLISTAHFIEQKAGWSDFFANIPFYGIREAQLKVFEYILNLQVFEQAAIRQEIQNELREIEEKWKLQAESAKSTAKKAGGELIGLPDNPEIMSTQIRPYVRFLRADKSLSFQELVSNISLDLTSIQLELNAPLNENLKRVEQNLEQLRAQTGSYEILYESLATEISQQKERLRQYRIQLRSVEEDVLKNKNAEKVQKLGLEANLKIASNTCPTCFQNIENTLLSEHIHVVPMRIDENLGYLDAQKKMVEAFINNVRERVIEMDGRLSAIEEAIQRNRTRIRSLKRDLVSDDRLPSQEVIERKVTLEREGIFLHKMRDEIDRSISSIYLLSKEFGDAKGRESNISKAYLSPSDASKIVSFEGFFTSYLKKFGFTSRKVDTIRISNEKYLPVYEFIQENGIPRQVDIRHESSASDFIRAQWAYYVSLFRASVANNGNHFNLLVFDEPQQQSASNENMKTFLEELAILRLNQTIVFASFQNSDEDFEDATKDLQNVNIVDFAKTREMVVVRIT